MRIAKGNAEDAITGFETVLYAFQPENEEEQTFLDQKMKEFQEKFSLLEK
jgi:hypothetical protein